MIYKNLVKGLVLVNIVILAVFSASLLVGRGQEAVAQEQEKETQRPPWQRTFDQRLKETVSYSFEREPLKEVLETYRKDLRLNIILDAKGRGVNPEAPITLELRNVRFESALSWTTRLAGLDYVIRNQAIFISRWESMLPEWRKEIPRREKEAKISLLEKFLPPLRDRFTKPVTVTIEGEPLSVALAQLSRLGEVNIIYLWDPATRPAPVTFQVENMTLENAFKWLLRLEGLDYLIIDEAIVVGQPAIIGRWKDIGLLLEGEAALAREVSFTFEEVPLRQAMEELQKMSGVEIKLESPEEVNPPITIKAENLELLAAVRIILSRLDLDYALTTSPQKDAINVLIRKKKPRVEAPPLPEEEETVEPEGEE
ncbi:MAG: hypothetical protein AMS15_07035 [Planctomycetes bacterium DG_23]|nr:MAG: hypothetical protein AMS15_07035 [Planctomycetes bacterium DG_23]